MKTRVQGRINFRTFLPNQKVLVANHVGKPKWFFGTIVKQKADRTYIVDIKGRQFKRHVDDIIPQYCETEDSVDDSWVYEYPSSDKMIDTRNQPRTSIVPRYSRRERRPIDRYGISNFV